MRYCIAYIDPEEVQIYFRKIADYLSAEFGISNLSKRIPAHITLKYPFEIDDTSDIEKQMEEVVQNIRQSARQDIVSNSDNNSGNIEPVNFIIGEFTRFDDGFETIFMKVYGDSNFEKIINTCIADLSEVDEERKFAKRIFHVSIVRHLNETISDKIFEYLNSNFNSDLSIGAIGRPHFKVAFDNIGLMEFSDEVWKVKRSFRLN